MPPSPPLSPPPPHTQTPTHTPPPPALFLFLCLTLAAALGCTPLDPKPFHDFAATTASLGPALDAAFQLDQEWTEAGLRERLVEGSPEELRELQTEVDAEGLEVRGEKDPLFIHLRKARRAAAALNAAARSYAELLASLAGDGALEQEQFDQLARDLQARSTAALQALEQSAGPDTEWTAPPAVATGTGILSVAAAESFRLWLEGERREALAEAIQKNQHTVDTWVALLRGSLHLIALGLKDEYQGFRRRLGKVLLDRNASQGAKRAAAAELLRREEELRIAMETLKTLERSYIALGDAHGDLRTYVMEPQWNLALLKQYQAHAAHLQTLYRELTDERE